MTDNPPHLSDPPPPPRMSAFALVGVIFNIIALILLLMGQITAGEVFVGLAIVAGLASLFGGRSGTRGGAVAGSSRSANG